MMMFIPVFWSARWCSGVVVVDVLLVAGSVLVAEWVSHDVLKTQNTHLKLLVDRRE